MSWKGVKQQTNNQNIIAWCDETGIKNYTIHPDGVIDVNGNVDLGWHKFEKLPYKFGKVSGHFNVSNNPNLISLEGCPVSVGMWFGCSECRQLESLNGCPQEVNDTFYCYSCKKTFRVDTIHKKCKVKTIKNKLVDLKKVILQYHFPKKNDIGSY